MILLSFSSKQVWPQVLSLLHWKPKHLVLFHTDDLGESKHPAQRFREFCAHTKLLAPESVELVAIPHDSFKDVVDTLVSTATKLKLDKSSCIVNLTGGNKLMAMAATEWCRLTGIPCCYLERDFRVFPFKATTTDLVPQPEFRLDPHLAGQIDPLALLRCQLGDAEVTDPGQKLILNEKGKNLPVLEIKHLIVKNEDFKKFLHWDGVMAGQNAGDSLEFATAFTLLKLNVPQVQRGVRLAPRLLREVGKEEGELDIVFNWGGRLWVVDCKDRKTPEKKVDDLRREILGQTSLSPTLHKMLMDLEGEIRERDLNPLKQDLLAVAEVGGLLGQAICVRRNPLPRQAADFARSRRIHVVMKDFLARDLRAILYPNQPASTEQLQALAAVRTRASA